MEKMILALDFGGTKHTVGSLVEGSTRWRSVKTAPSGENPNADRDIEIMLGLARSALEGAQPSAVGVSFGGPVDFGSGTVRLSHHVEGWEGYPLRSLLSREFNAGVIIDNDANAAALGEWRFGAGRGSESLFYVTVSTGVGGGWIIDGKPWRGRDSMAGEIGHTVVDPRGPECLCGKRGCVERLASGPYMAADARKMLEHHPAQGKILRRLARQGSGIIDGKTLAEAANLGDDIAVQILARGSRSLGMELGNVANLMNPERIILGGGITKSGPPFWEPLLQAVEQTRLNEVAVQILPAATGDEAPLWGAVALAEALL